MGKQITGRPDPTEILARLHRLNLKRKEYGLEPILQEDLARAINRHKSAVSAAFNDRYPGVLRAVVPVLERFEEEAEKVTS